MGLEFMTDEDLQKIVEAALLLNEEFVEPTEEVVAAISDGDDDIPIMIRNFAKIRFSFWHQIADGVHFLKIERKLDKEQFDASHDVREEGE